MHSPTTRSTIYFEPELHKTLRLKAASTHRSVSDLVNEAVRLSLAEDQEDLSAFAERVAEPAMSYGEMKNAAVKRNRRQPLPKVMPLAADAGWDAWFDGPAATDDFMRKRDQPAEQERETL